MIKTMKSTKRIVVLLSAVCLTVWGTVNAQEVVVEQTQGSTTQASYRTVKIQGTDVTAPPTELKWFVAASSNSVLALNNTWNKTQGVRLSGGAWINKFTGFRLNARANNMWLQDGFTAKTIGGGIDWMASLHKGGRRDDKAWNFNAFIGIGYEYYQFADDYSPRYTHISTLNGYFSVQATCKLGEHFQLFAEPGLNMTPKAYDLDRDDDVFASAFLNIGAIYRF